MKVVNQGAAQNGKPRIPRIRHRRTHLTRSRLNVALRCAVGVLQLINVALQLHSHW
jgi:hypothetical protein